MASLPAALAKLNRNQAITPDEADLIVGQLRPQGEANPYANFKPGATNYMLTGTSGGGGGHSFWGGLKDLGKGVLNTLAVPGNTLVTTLGNAVLAAQGKDLMSWKNVVGAFRGHSPGADFLEREGVGPGLARTLGGIGIDLAVDPLWATGVAKIPRAVEGVEEAARGVRGVEHLRDEARLAGGLTRAEPEVIPEATRLAKVRPQHDVHVPRGDHPTLGKLGRLGQRGRLVDDKFFVFRANKNNAKPLFKIARLEDPGRLTSADHVLPYEFMSAADAERGAHGLADLEARNLRAGSLEEGGIVTPNATREGLDALRSTLTKDALRDEQYAVKLGVGRKALKIPTGVGVRKTPFTFAGKTGGEIGKALNTRFVKHPVAKAARTLERVTRDTQASIMARSANLAKQLGLDAQDASRIGTYLGVRRAGKSAGDYVRGEMQHMGIWKPEYDRAVEVFDEHYGRMSRDVGKYSKEDVPQLRAKMKQAEKVEDWDEAEHWRGIIAAITGRPYAPSARAADINARLADEIRQSQILSKDVRSGGYLPGANPFAERELPHAFALQSRDDVAAQLKAELGLSDEQAETLTDAIGAGLEHSTGQAFLNKTANYELVDGTQLPYRSNLDAFDLFSHRASAQVQRQLNDQVTTLLKDAGLDTPQGIEDARQLIMRSTDTSKVPGTIKSTGGVFNKFEQATQFMKLMFTSVLPAHYVRNAAGDFSNTFVNGNLRHVLAGPQVGADQWGKLVRAERRGNEELLDKLYDVNGMQFTGSELLTMARLSGAGVGTKVSHGFVGEDIKGMVDLLQASQPSKNPFVRYTRFMKQANVDRENAQRLRTWVLHMKGGDDMFTAAAKTIRTSFDYGDLTNFEKVWMRNLLLFYTWFRKNTALHLGGLATRPGLYAAAGQMEAGRDKFANEPGYFGSLGLLQTPLGLVSYGSPIADAMSKLDLTESGIRRSTIGQLTPLLQVPVGLATGSNPVTGQQFATHPVPSIWGNLPLVGTTASAYSRGPRGPAIDSKIAYILGAISPSPVAAANAVTNPGYEGDTIGDLLGRLSGIQVEQNQPQKFAAIAGIKRRDQQSQANANKRYNIG